MPNHTGAPHLMVHKASLQVFVDLTILTTQQDGTEPVTQVRKSATYKISRTQFKYSVLP